jgi:hypothetical protein
VAVRRLWLLLLLGGCADPVVADERAPSSEVGDGSGSTSVASTTGDPGASGTPGRVSHDAEPSTGSDASGTTSTEELLPGPTWPAYEDVSDVAGVNAPHAVALGHQAIGQAWGDYDRDGWLDLYVTGGTHPSVLYRNRGDGTFEPAAAGQALALPAASTAGPAWGDYDNDGWLDLYVTCDGPNRLFHNDAGAGFTELALAAGVQDPRHGAMAAWGDYDRDGWLDLYVANHGGDSDGFYHNDGNGRFSDVGALIGSGDHPTAAFAMTFIDYDHDDDLDLHVVNDHLRGNDLFRNDGPGCAGWCFTNVRHETGTDLDINGMGQAVGDYDRDGDLDLFFSDIFHTHLLQSLTAQGLPEFHEVTLVAGVEVAAISWGTVFLDYDLDGWLDLYLATEDAEPGLTNRLLRNRGDGTFEDVSELSGADDHGFTYGAVHADYDHDGFVDLVIGNRGEGYRLLHNTGTTGPGHHWVALDLAGGGPINRDAIGTRVTVVDTLGIARMDEVRSGSTMGGGSMLRLHFGLGAGNVQRVEIRWPNGQLRTLHDVPTDAVVEIAYPG